MSLPRVYNRHNPLVPKDAVYVGRPSIWGNPYLIGSDGNRDQCIEKYREYINKNKPLLARIGELKGKNLVCWCAPKACHADVLLELANESSNQ